MKNILFMKYIHLFKTNSEFTEAYNGPDYIAPWLSLTEETRTINSSKILTAITFGSITWITDVPATGGTATKDNCTFKVYANYNNGSSSDISSIVTITGKLAVPSSTSDQRHEAGQLTLTASYGGFTATGNVTVYQAADFSTEPLTFNILSAGTINWAASSSVTKTIEYKLNNDEWVSITSKKGSSAPTINVVEGDKIQFRGNNEQYASGYSAYNSFSGSTASFELEGNIMSLIYGDDFKNNLAISGKYTFLRLFEQCVNLVSAENLVLPATTLASYCYFGMFSNCTSLRTAPVLPATTLASCCYEDMFEGCTSLTTAPVLPATTVADSCYFGMFSNCTSLTTAPALPATTVLKSCYRKMFLGCTSLTTAPELPSTSVATSCYDSMFQGCTSLTRAPELLKDGALAMSCYNSMFKDCTSLNYIKCLATNITAYLCTNDWVSGVASTGTFVKNPNMTSWTTGTSGIPEGWTVQDA